MKQTIKSDDIQITFVCGDCDFEESCSVSEAVYNGPPLCPRCNYDNEMKISHFYIEE